MGFPINAPSVGNQWAVNLPIASFPAGMFSIYPVSTAGFTQMLAVRCVGVPFTI